MDEGQVGNFLTIALVILGCFLAFLVVIYIICISMSGSPAYSYPENGRNSVKKR